MLKRLNIRWWIALGAFLISISALGQLQKQIILPSEQLPPPKPKRKPKPSFSTYLPVKPSLPPAARIELAPLGFVSPKASYFLGRGIHLVSVDFLDDNRLLFTYHPTGLLQRDTDETGSGVKRQIKAVVLQIPDGTVDAEATWTVSDRSRYLWMLKDGKFLLRTGDGLQEGNEKLEVKPLPQLQGSFQSLALSPDGQILVASSQESAPSQASQPAAASSVAQMPVQTRFAADDQNPGDELNFLVRAIRLSSGEVVLSRHTHAALNFPVNSTGYVEISSPKKYQWVLTTKSFKGDSKALKQVESGCAPHAKFINDNQLFLSTCTPEGGLRLAVLSTSGKELWATDAPPEAMWPLLIMSPDGSRMARESFVLNEGVDLKKHPKFTEAVKGQEVKVVDAASGNQAFEAPLTPVLDAGGNVAFSPSGRRFAILDNDAIQVFDLPPVVPVSSPAPAGSHPRATP
jgi:WD40 repeat protein